jgi:hypothetical protein
MNMRRIVTLAALYSGDQDRLQGAKNELTFAHDGLMTNINLFRASVDNDAQADIAARTERITQLTELRGMVERYMEEVAWPTLEYAQANDMDRALAMIESGINMNASIYTHFEAMSRATHAYMDNIGVRLASQTNLHFDDNADADDNWNSN